ncbi:hypothetical protein SAMD00020551_0232 [Mesobacillus selenatarsenatis SF-1]|uniref:Uncharacterized protein n=1 Tax=Mesobacillus selenatarsenatis (strain DSM 18680 / JCM 14380 / FERM P-15431 / SF-1) TaxID=1321606 RepID=A0A0A8WWW6_MESS1|nr:hypothetical protein SAMD00020551_0232 [Mesobacillus selenatarsenatis SF-1]
MYCYRLTVTEIKAKIKAITETDIGGNDNDKSIHTSKQRITEHG